MGILKRLIPALLAAGVALGLGADWLSLRGDAQNSGWQRDEKTLNTRTVGRLHLLWQHKLSDAPDSVTDPLILGPIITHRGIKELVFVQNQAGSVYAIDADLGRIFWNRSLGSASACSGARPVQPTMNASATADAGRPSGDDDNFSDGNRPLYTLTAAGMVFPLRPSTGDDFSPPFQFVPAGVFPLRIGVSDTTLTIATAETCGGIAKVDWSIPVSAAGVPLGRAAPAGASRSGFAVEFTWHGKSWQATVDQNGAPRLWPAGRAVSQTTGRLASWEDGERTRWIYTAAQNQVGAFQLRSAEGGEPAVTPSWRLSNLGPSGPPVVANGIVYFLAKTAVDGLLTLRAVDALTGKELYTSKDLITSRASSGNLAVANGHVCFSATDSQTYCFGLPFEM